MAGFRRWAEAQTLEKKEEIKTIVRSTVYSIDRRAKMFAPTDKSYLKSSVHPRFTADGLGGSVYLNRDYAPYVEFGTGKNAAQFTSQNPDIAEYAMEFFVSGKGKNKAQPFLFPAVRISMKEMEAKMKQIGFNERSI